MNYQDEEELEDFINYKINIRSIDPRKGNDMNDNLNTVAIGNATPVANADMDAANKLLLTEDQLELLLAGKAFGPGSEVLAYADGQPIAYTADPIEADDEPTPTVH